MPPLRSFFCTKFLKASNKLAMDSMEMEMEMKRKMDFISELPDEILHHIFSFLDMIFIVRTSILSKRWRYIWRSTHFLSFNEELFNTTTTTQLITSEEAAAESNSNNGNEDDTFIDFVNKTLFLHCKSNINTFTISGVELLSRSLTWTPIWRSSDAENRRTLDLPIRFFNSNTLTTLKLDMGSKKGRQIFKIPDLGSVDLPCLKTLYLGSIILVDGDSISGFFSKCLVLEALIISSCLLEERNDLNINGLQLKYLELGIACVKRTCIGDNTGKITVFAPKLKSFLCRDLLLSEFYFDLGNVSGLSGADLDACLASSPVCLCVISPNYSPQREEEYNQNVLECIRNVCTVKSLSLNMRLLKDKFQGHISFQGLLNPFCNLRFLQLKTLFFFQEHIVIIALLEMCPYLQTLILQRSSKVIGPYKCMENGPASKNTNKLGLNNHIDFRSSRKEEVIAPSYVGSQMAQGPVARPLDKIYSKNVNKVDEYWEVKEPLQCMSHYLQFVEIWGVFGTLDELKFLRFLMKNAVMLVKLILVTSDLCRSESYFEGCLRMFLKKFEELPKASSSVEISVVPS